MTAGICKRLMGVVALGCVAMAMMGTVSPVQANVDTAVSRGGEKDGAQQWYIYREEAVFGPYSETRMFAFIAEGRVTAKTQVRAADGSQWQRAADVFEPLRGNLTVASRVTAPSKPAAITEAEAGRIRPEIQSAKTLAAMSVGLWSAGKVLQLIWPVVIVASGYDVDDRNYNALFTTFWVGTGVDLLSAIPAILAERRVQHALSKARHGLHRSVDPRRRTGRLPVRLPLWAERCCDLPDDLQLRGLLGRQRRLQCPHLGYLGEREQSIRERTRVRRVRGQNGDRVGNARWISSTRPSRGGGPRTWGSTACSAPATPSARWR